MVRLRRIASVLVVAVFAFYLGGFLEFQYGGFAPNWVKTLMFYQPPKNDLDFKALEEVFSTIQRRYVGTDIDSRKLTEGAASGMVSALGDRFSRYLNPEEFQANETFLEGSFEGIGASVIEKSDQIQIASVLPKTPAERGGLRAGDVIISVDGQSTKGWTSNQAVLRIRGRAGSHVVLGIDRGGQRLTVDLVRETINVDSVVTHVFDNRVLYIRVYHFGNRTAQEFDQALKDNLKGSVQGIVLDLRGNPGGFIDTANQVISEFVRKGPSMILVQRNGKEDVKTVTGNGRAFDSRVVVLLNESSASASEITAGALQDYGRGRLVGTKTFGKGSVQEDFPVRDGDLHLTIAHWLTPNRHSIDTNGLIPDDVVTLDRPEDEYAVEQAPTDFRRDRQLTAALAILGR